MFDVCSVQVLMRPLSTAVKLTVRKASQHPEKLMSISKVNLSENRGFLLYYIAIYVICC